MSSADVSDNDCNDASDIEIVTDTVRGFLPCYPSAWLSPIHDYQMIGPRLMPAVSKQTFISRLLNTMLSYSLVNYDPAV